MFPKASIALLCVASCAILAQEVSAIVSAQSALRDGAAAFAASEADEAIADANSPQELQEAFLVAAAARERTLPPADMIAWLDGCTNFPAAPSAYYRARALSSLGCHAEAVPLLKDLRSAFPDDVELSHCVVSDLAYALASSGSTDEAINILESASKADYETKLSLAHLLIATGNNSRAERILRPMVTKQGCGEAALLMARSIGGSGDSESALKVLTENIISSSSASPDVKALATASAAILRSSSKIDAKSLDLAREALELAQSEIVRLDCLATLLRLQARFGLSDEALELSRTLVVAAPRMSITEQAVADAALLLQNADEHAAALALAKLYLASFINPSRDYDMECLKAVSLSALDRNGEASAAYLRAAVAASTDAARYEATFAAAGEQLKAGFNSQAVATLDSILSETSNAAKHLHPSAALLRAEALTTINSVAAYNAYLGVAESFPDSDETPLALYKAGQLISSATTTNNLQLTPGESEQQFSSNTLDVTNGLPRALELYHKAASIAEARSVTNNPSTQIAQNAANSVFRSEISNQQIQADSALAEAITLQRMGNYSNAIVSLDVAAKVAPDGSRTAEQSAALRPLFLDALGKVDEAIAAHEAFTNAFPNSEFTPEALFWRAARAFNSCDWTSAARFFTEFTTRFPYSDRMEWALYYQVSACFRAGRFADAAAGAQTFTSSFPSSSKLSTVRFIRAEACCQLLDFRSAESICEALQMDPKVDPPLRLKATIRRADCAFTLSGTDLKCLEQSAQLYAEALASPICNEAGFTLECEYKLGRCLERSGLDAEAVKRYYRGVVLPFEMSPTAQNQAWYARAILAAASVYERMGNTGDAKAVLRRLASSGLPGATEASRRLSALSFPTDNTNRN